MSKLWSPAIFETFKCAYNGLQTYNKACKEDGTILVQLISLVYIVFMVFDVNVCDLAAVTDGYMF